MLIPDTNSFIIIVAEAVCPRNQNALAGIPAAPSSRMKCIVKRIGANTHVGALALVVIAGDGRPRVPVTCVNIHCA